MSNGKRSFGEIIGYISGASVLVACLFAIFSKWNLTFDDLNQKVDTIKATQSIPTEVEKYKQQHQLDTLVKLMVEQGKKIDQNTNHLRKIDSVNKDLQTRTSDQVYQINQKLEKNGN